VTDALAPVTDALTPVIVPITDAVVPGGSQPFVPLLPGETPEPGIATSSPLDALSAVALGLARDLATSTSTDGPFGIFGVLATSAEVLAPSSELFAAAASAAPAVAGHALALGAPASGGLAVSAPGAASAGAAAAGGGIAAALFAFAGAAFLLPGRRGRLTNSTGPISPVYPTDVSPD